jgi:hypothetical protein
VFRIPGSVRTVNELYGYYSADGEDGDDISSTICSATLPAHIRTGPHEVASLFKRLLSGLPGGILGSLLLFEILADVHDRLGGDVGPSQAHQTEKDRARLIVLSVVGTVKSLLRRDLIFAVFGLLGLIASEAEQTSREEEFGLSNPASDLMGYGALGIIFGPLLVGDLLNSYSILGAGDAAGPGPPPNMRADSTRNTSTADGQLSSPTLMVDRINVANGVAEMLISHWTEVVRQARKMGLWKSSREGQQRTQGLRPSATDGFALRLPLQSSAASVSSGEFSTPTGPEPDVGKRLLLALGDLVRANLLTFSKSEGFEEGSPARDKNSPTSTQECAAVHG